MRAATPDATRMARTPLYSGHDRATVLPHVTRHPTRRTLIGGLGLGAASLVARPAAAAATPDKTTPSKPIVIGAIFPESGPQSLIGNEAWRGVDLAVEVARPTFETGIRILRGDATRADTAIKDMIKQAGKPDAISVILGSQSSTDSFVATAAAELAGIPYVELDAPAGGITKRDFKMLIRTGTTTEDFAAATESAITGLLMPGWRMGTERLRLALLFDIGATNGSFAGAMLDACKRAGLPVILSMAYGTDTMDLSEEIGRMQRAKIDLLIHAGHTEHVLLLYEGLRAAAWRPRMIIGAGPGYGMSPVGYALGGTLDNTLVVGNPLYGPAAAAIEAAYRQRYAGPPRGAASLTTHVGAALTLDALHSGKPVLKALAASHRKSGLLANGWGVDFDSNGQNRASFVTLQQWRNGTLVTVDPKIKGAAKPILTL